MRSQFLPLLKNEIVKASRRRLPYFGIFAVGLLCVVIFFTAGCLSNAATVNGWGYLAFSMQLVFTDLGPVFILNFAAMLLSQEAGSGTIRAALAVPVLRFELYLAKAAIGLLYMLVLWLAALVFSAGLAMINYHFGAVGDSFGEVYSRHLALREFVVGGVLSWFPLAALVALGLFVSTIVRTPGAAVSIATASLFIIDFTKNLVGLGPYIFTKDIGYSWVVLLQLAQGTDYQWQPEVWSMIILSSVFALLAFCAGLIIFTREDLNH